MLESIKIKDIYNIAIEAGKAIMEIYKEDFSVEFKADNSPLTKADLAANEIICNFLKTNYPQIPILSEENLEVPYEKRKNWEYYWCIDPIDGTKEFVKKNGEFTINIALIHKNTPVLGVVYAPAIEKLYYAKKGNGAFRVILDNKYIILNKEKLPIIKNSKLNSESVITIAASNSHLSIKNQEFVDDIKRKIKDSQLIKKGSSLKLCMVATGEVDIYPRLSPTMEWDTAAADAIVRESKKMCYIYQEDFDILDVSAETPLFYNKQNLLNPYFIVI